MTLKDLQEAVENIKNFYGEALYSKDAGIVTKGVQTLLSLATLFIEAEKGMPKKKITYDKIEFMIGGKTVNQVDGRYNAGFNSAIDLCTAHWAAKCERIGNTIQDFFHKSNEIILDDEGHYCGKVELTELSQAIRKELVR